MKEPGDVRFIRIEPMPRGNPPADAGRRCFSLQVLDRGCGRDSNPPQYYGSHSTFHPPTRLVPTLIRRVPLPTPPVSTNAVLSRVGLFPGAALHQSSRPVQSERRFRSRRNVLPAPGGTRVLRRMSSTSAARSGNHRGLEGSPPRNVATHAGQDDPSTGGHHGIPDPILPVQQSGQISPHS